MFRWKVLVASLAAGALALGTIGCSGDTSQGATNVTDTAATLRAHLTCNTNDSGDWYFQYSVAGSGVWQDGAHHPFTCGNNADVPSWPETVTGLTPSTPYVYRIADNVGSCAPCWADSTGQFDGTNYSPFTTKPPGAAYLRSGLAKQWEDNGTYADPVASHIWTGYDLYPIGHPDFCCLWENNLSGIVSGEYVQHSSGGPSAAFPAYWTTWGDPNGPSTPNSVGRGELGYPVGDNTPSGTTYRGPSSQHSYFFYEGQRRVVFFSVRLASSWNLSATNWRVLAQLKQNEWVQCIGCPGSPALSVEEEGGHWVLDNFGNRIQTLATAATGQWVNIALDVTFSGNAGGGHARAYIDTDNDGYYDFAGPTFNGQTLAVTSGGDHVESTLITGVYEEIAGDTADKAALSIWG
jgi:Polysaccharide lyase